MSVAICLPVLWLLCDDPTRGLIILYPSLDSLRNEPVSQNLPLLCSSSCLQSSLPSPSLPLSYWYTSEAEDSEQCVCVVQKSVLYFLPKSSAFYCLVFLGLDIKSSSLYSMSLWLSKSHRYHVRLALSSYYKFPSQPPPPHTFCPYKP